MITDILTTFCDGLALNTGVPGTNLLGDVIDLQNPRDIGNGTPLFLVISMAQAATSAGAATAQFQLVSDTQAALSTATSTVHLVTGTFAVADMAAGTSIIQISLPLQGAVYERYLGVLQTTGGVAFTGGIIDAFLTPTPQNNVHYPEQTSA